MSFLIYDYDYDFFFKKDVKKHACVLFFSNKKKLHPVRDAS